ncbi:hypothetical protein BH09ACT7_BH09ACT7_05110 [soil metagenome]
MWSDFLSWWTEPWGIRTQATAALLFQLAGVYLVVQDIRDSGKRLTRLGQRFGEIDTNLRQTYDEHNRMAAEAMAKDVMSKTREEMEHDFGVVFATPFMSAYEGTAALEEKLAELANLQYTRDRAAPQWLGVALLLLGIVFSFTAAVLAT